MTQTSGAFDVSGYGPITENKNSRRNNNNNNSNPSTAAFPNPSFFSIPCDSSISFIDPHTPSSAAQISDNTAGYNTAGREVHQNHATRISDLTYRRGFSASVRKSVPDETHAPPRIRSSTSWSRKSVARAKIVGGHDDDVNGYTIPPGVDGDTIPPGEFRSRLRKFRARFSAKLTSGSLEESAGRPPTSDVLASDLRRGKSLAATEMGIPRRRGVRPKTISGCPAAAAKIENDFVCDDEDGHEEGQSLPNPADKDSCRLYATDGTGIGTAGTANGAGINSAGAAADGGGIAANGAADTAASTASTGGAHCEQQDGDNVQNATNSQPAVVASRQECGANACPADLTKQILTKSRAVERHNKSRAAPRKHQPPRIRGSLEAAPLAEYDSLNADDLLTPAYVQPRPRRKKYPQQQLLQQDQRYASHQSQRSSETRHYYEQSSKSKAPSASEQLNVFQRSTCAASPMMTGATVIPSSSVQLKSSCRRETDIHQKQKFLPELAGGVPAALQPRCATDCLSNFQFSLPRNSPETPAGPENRVVATSSATGGANKPKRLLVGKFFPRKPFLFAGAAERQDDCNPQKAHFFPMGQTLRHQCCGGRDDAEFKKKTEELQDKSWFLTGEGGVKNDLARFDEAHENNDVKVLVELLDSGQPFARGDPEMKIHPWAAPPRTVGTLAAFQLASLASKETDADEQPTKNAIREFGGIPKFVNYLTSAEDDRKHAAVVALSFLAIENAKNCQEMRDARALEPLIECMKLPPDGLKGAAADTCRNIYSLDVMYRQEFVALGGVPVLVALLDLPTGEYKAEELFNQSEAIYHIEDLIMEDALELPQMAKAVKDAGAVKRLEALTKVDSSRLQDDARKLLSSLAD